MQKIKKGDLVVNAGILESLNYQKETLDDLIRPDYYSLGIVGSISSYGEIAIYWNYNSGITKETRPFYFVCKNLNDYKKFFNYICKVEAGDRINDVIAIVTLKNLLKLNGGKIK